MKKTLLFVIAAVFSCMTVFSQATEVNVIAEGNCGKLISEGATNKEPNVLGDNLKWKLTSDSVLTITGTGELGDSRAFGTTPWAKYKNNIKTVIIGEGCTYIGKFSFHTCNNMSTVKLPSTLTEIGDMAFMAFAGQKSSLKSIELPAKLKTIGMSAFMGSVLESITIPEGVKEIGQAAFMTCKKLVKVELPQSLKTIGINAFNQCEALPSIVIPSKVSNIEVAAFWKCKALKDITMPEKVSHIGGKAFTETPWYTEWLGKQADGVLYMGTTVYGYKGTMKDSTILEIKDGARFIGAEAFKDNKNIIGIKLPETIAAIEEKAFYRCSKFAEVNLPARMYMLGKESFRETNIDTIALPEGIDRLEGNTFYKCTNLKSVKLSPAMTYMGQGSLYGCTALDSIMLPSKLVEMSSEIFSNCANLKTIKVEAVVPPMVKAETFKNFDAAKAKLIVPIKSLDAYKAAEGWKTFTNMTGVLPGGQCGDNATWSMDAEGVLTISGTGDMWDLGSFSSQPWDPYKKEIKKLVIEEGITSVGVFAFHTCNNIASIEFPSTLKSIGDMAFMQFAFSEKNYIESIKLPESLEYIGSSAFYGTSLRSIEVPAGVDTIQTGVFMGCDSLRTVELAEGVRVIGMNAFGMCKSLKSVVLPSTVDSICNMAFKMNKIETFEVMSIVPPAVDGDPFMMTSKELKFIVPLKSLDKYKADEYWKQFTNIAGVLPHGKCGDNAKWSMGADSVLTISGTGEMWDLVSFAAQPWGAFKKEIKGLVIEEGITSVGRFTFHTCSNIESIKFPSTLKTIGDMAFMQFPFKERNKITSVELPESLEYIGSSAFYGTLLKSVTIPASIDTIETGVFMACDSLKSVNMPEGLKVIGMNAFGMDKALKSVVVPSTVDSIGKLAFKMTKLERFELKAMVPPTAEPDIFDMANTEFEFVVPEAALEAYKADEFWKQFIKETETDVEENETSEVVVYSNGTELVIEGAEGDFAIYNVTGSVVYVGNDKVVELPRGIYIVKGENFCEKVIL